MIKIDNNHYQQLINLVRLMGKNMTLLNGSQASSINKTLQIWSKINKNLEDIYLEMQLKIQKSLKFSQQMQQQKQFIECKLQKNTKQKEQLEVRQVMHRADLAKLTSDVSKLKNNLQKAKDQLKKNQQREVNTIQKLNGKIKKYKQYYEQKIKELQFKMKQLQVNKKNEVIAQVLDKQIIELQKLQAQLCMANDSASQDSDY